MIESDDDENNNQMRDNLIFDLIKKRFDSEIARTNNLDSKANSIVGFISLLVGLLLGSGSILTGAETFTLELLKENMIMALIYFMGIAFLLVSIGFALLSLKIRRWIIVPNVQTLVDDYINLPYLEVLQRNAGEMAKAVLNSEKLNNNKAKLIEYSWYFLIVGISIVFISVMILIMGKIQ